MPRTYATKPGPAVSFWAKRKLRPPSIDVLEVVKKRAHYLLSEVPPQVEGSVLQTDSRKISDRQVAARFRWVITSPPYLGMRTYVPDQWLRNWFLGGPAGVEYSDDTQLGRESEEAFVTDLAAVWKRITTFCLPGAHLIVRFGALPSLDREPAKLLKKTLERADCGWVIKTIKKAGRASGGKRQAYQFSCQTKAAVEEIDLHAVLEP
jgi:hypothetical protein